MLALTASERPHRRFHAIWDALPRWPDVDRDALARQRFNDAKSPGPELVFHYDRLENLVIRIGVRHRLMQR